MIVQGLAALVEFLSAFWGLVFTLGTWVLDGGLFVLKGCSFLIFDGVLTAITAIFSGISISTFLGGAALAWAGVPPQLVYVVNQCGIPAGLAVLVSALGIRMALNLIPAEFTRI